MTSAVSGGEERPPAGGRFPAGTPLIVIGCSWGGLAALHAILARLPADLPAATAIVQHRMPDAEETLLGLLARDAALPIRSPDDKEPIVAGVVYLAPPNYHLLVDRDHLALSTDAPVNYSRPSIDVLFESAARTYGPDVIGVVLTGANADGAAGLAEIRRLGGRAIVQDPATAEVAIMPQAALDRAGADEVLPVEKIAGVLVRLCRTSGRVGRQAR